MDGSLNHAPGAGNAAPPHESLWQRLNPLRHFAAALGWAMFALVVAGALVAGQWAANEAERHVAASARARLAQTANQAGDALLAQVRLPLAAMQAVAGQWALQAPPQPAAMAARLAALQARVPELGWLGVLDARGQWQGMTDAWPGADALPGQPWLAQAASRAVVALHRGRGMDGEDDALLLAVPQGGTETDADADAPPAGVLVARLPWLWLQAQLDAHLRAMGDGEPVELMLLGPGGRLLAASRAVRGRPAGLDWSEGGRYLVGQAGAFFSPVAQAATTPGIAAPGVWQLRVRERADRALAPARQTHRAVLAGVLAVGLLAALAAALVAHRLLARLDALARQARAVRRGERTRIDVPPGRDEVHAIGATLADLVDGLQQEQARLARLNAELDARVNARAARIQRLAEDARHAAVTRERLRLARGLHDTLAHSLMALLTQVRLLRKLGPRWSREELEAELARTEDVATEGLAEVRAAIGQMREASVHDSGLGPELAALLARFAERTGVQVQSRIDPAAAELVNERAATVFSIAREALRNVEHHAGAAGVTLELQAQPAPELDSDAPVPWHLTLTDDGCGFDPHLARPGHYGLTGLREQAAQFGGAIEIDSAPGRGCRITLHFTA